MICCASVSALAAAAEARGHAADWNIFFNQAEVEAGDCTQGYPCGGSYGTYTPPPGGITTDVITTSSWLNVFRPDNSVIGTCNADGSITTVNTASMFGEVESKPADKAVKTVLDAGLGAAVGNFFDQAKVAAREVTQAILYEANDLLPSTNYARVADKFLGWGETGTGAVFGAMFGAA
jgi:hypothetical protein